MNLLSPPAPSIPAVVGFVVLVFAVVGVVIAAASTASRGAGEDDATASARRRRTAVGLLAWLAFTFAAAASGALARFDVMPPPVMVLVAASAIASITLAFSKFGKMLACGLPLAALVGFHAFRVPLELLLHRLSLDGVLPVQMTYDGMNFDIVTGLTAALLALWAAVGRPSRVVVLVWNVMGLKLLLTIVTIAILSAPLPLRVFMNEPANTIITTAPFVWLPTVLVQAALIGHLLVFRRLWYWRDL